MRYRVWLEQTQIWNTSIDVEAPNEEDAKEKAIDLSNKNSIQWDGGDDDTQVESVELLEEEEPAI